MKLIIKLFILFVFLGKVGFCQEVKFVHITDINLDSNNAYYLQETIKEINSLKNIDFVVFGGNNIKKPNMTNLKTFAYLVKKTHKKRHILLGSNDVLTTSGIDKKYYLKKVRAKGPNYTFSKKGYLFVVMDGSKQYFYSTNGYYTKDELIWLERILNKNKNKNIIILQHFPVLESSSKWQETAKIEEYQELLSKYDNVKVIVSGHYDTNQEIKKDGIYHIITESYSKNHAYKIIQIDLKNDFIGSYLIK